VTQIDAPRFDNRPVNKPAITAMIAGLLLCIPGSGIVAIIFGYFGMRRARLLDGAGKTQAMLGLVLGLIQVVWGSAIMVGVFTQYRTYTVAKPAFETTRQWIMLVGGGNINAAVALTRPPIDEAMLTDTAEAFGLAGVIKDVNPYYGGAVHSKTNVEVQAMIDFDRSSKLLTTWWDVTKPQAPQMTWYTFADAPTTQPATQKK